MASGNYGMVIENDKLYAVLSDDSNGFEVQLCLPLEPIRRRIVKLLSNRVGWSWSDLKRGVSKAVKRAAALQAVRRLEELAKAHADELGSIYPPLGVSIKAIKTMSRLIDKAKKNDPHARDSIAYITEQADAGNPEAIRYRDAMSKIYLAKKYSAEAQVSGWVWNVPFRGMLEARELDKSNPSHIHRYLYKQGLDEDVYAKNGNGNRRGTYLSTITSTL